MTIASNDKLSGYTPEMIREYLVKRRGVELGGLIDLFEKTCFGGYVPDEAEWKMVYAEYKVQWKSSQSVRKLLWSLIRICNEMAVRKNSRTAIFLYEKGCRIKQQPESV